MDPDVQPVQLCVQAIRRYLDDHPDAADSLRGVVDWWVPSQAERMSPAVVLAALQRLIESGEIEGRRVLGNRLMAADELRVDQTLDDPVIFSRRR